MIVVDSSALAAIAFGEPQQSRFETILSSGVKCVVPAANPHETVMVLRSRPGPDAVGWLWATLQVNGIEIVPFDETRVRAAADGFDRYGKGINPKSRLNLADCAAYAPGRTPGAPVLFKGDDVMRTDIEACA